MYSKFYIGDAVLVALCVHVTRARVVCNQMMGSWDSRLPRVRGLTSAADGCSASSQQFPS